MPLGSPSSGGLSNSCWQAASRQPWTVDPSRDCSTAEVLPGAPTANEESAPEMPGHLLLTVTILEGPSKPRAPPRLRWSCRQACIGLECFHCTFCSLLLPPPVSTPSTFLVNIMSAKLPLRVHFPGSKTMAHWITPKWKVLGLSEHPGAQDERVGAQCHLFLWLCSLLCWLQIHVSLQP